MTHRVDPSTDVLAMLERLRELVEKPKKFGPITFGFNPDEMAMQINQVRACLPKEVRDAASLARERDRILTESKSESDALMDYAKREAQRVVDDAKAEAERTVKQAELAKEQMLADSEILKLAKSQADEIRASADREANQMRRGADNYAHDVLANLEGVVERVLGTVQRGKAEIDMSESTKERVRLS